MSVCVCVCVCECMRVCVCVSVRACVYALKVMKIASAVLLIIYDHKALFAVTTFINLQTVNIVRDKQYQTLDLTLFPYRYQSLPLPISLSSPTDLSLFPYQSHSLPLPICLFPYRSNSLPLPISLSSPYRSHSLPYRSHSLSLPMSLSSPTDLSRFPY